MTNHNIRKAWVYYTETFINPIKKCFDFFLFWQNNHSKDVLHYTSKIQLIKLTFAYILST